MITTDVNRPLTAAALNESMFKKFNVKINFAKYDRGQLESYYNTLHSKLVEYEAHSNFNEPLFNETYQKNKFIQDVISLRIQELKEAKMVNEKAVSKAQQKAAGIALAAKKSGKTLTGTGASASMEKMPKKELEKFAKTKQKGLPKKKSKVDESKMTAGDSAHHHATQYVKHHSDGDLGLASHHLEACESHGGLLQHHRGKVWHQHAGRNGGVPYKVEMDEPSHDHVDDVEGSHVNNPIIKDPFTDSDPFFDDVDYSQRRYNKKISEDIARYITEDEEAKAIIIAAATEMVNDLSHWTERTGQYLNKSTIEFGDEISTNFGNAESEQYTSAVSDALNTLLPSLAACRKAIHAAVTVLADPSKASGEVMGAEPIGGEGEQPGTEPEAQFAPEPDEFGASDAASGGANTAGREKRESIERGNRLMMILS